MVHIILSFLVTALITPLQAPATLFFSPVKICYRNNKTLQKCEKELRTLKKRNRTDIKNGIKKLLASSDQLMRELGLNLAYKLSIAVIKPDMLERFLKSKNSKNIITSLKYIRKFRPKIHPQVLLPLIGKNNNKFIIMYAVKILGQTNEKTAVKSIRKLLSSNDPEVLSAVVYALAILKDDKSLPKIIDLYISPFTSIFIKIETLKAFQVFHEPKLASIVLLESGRNDVSLKKFIIQTLGALRAKQFATLLTMYLNNPILIRDVLLAWGQMKTTAVIPELVKILQKTNLPTSTLKLIFWCFGQIKSPSSLPVILSELNSGISTREQFAAETLGYMGNKEAIKPLINKLNAKNIQVSDLAQWSLVKITGQTFEKNKKLWDNWYKKTYFKKK